MSHSFLARTTAAILALGSFFAVASSSVAQNPRGHSDRLIEGRAVYEAQVSFGAARENDRLGRDVEFGVATISEIHLSAGAR